MATNVVQKLFPANYLEGEQMHLNVQAIMKEKSLQEEIRAI